MPGAGDDVLLPGPVRDEANAIGADMVCVRDRLTRVRAFITQRLRRPRGDLQGREERTVRCPHCEQLAMVAEGETNRCLFRGAVDTTQEMMVYAYLGTPEDEGSLIGICPTCTQHTVVYDTELATGDRMPFCFSCPGPPSTADALPLPDDLVSGLYKWAEDIDTTLNLDLRDREDGKYDAEWERLFQDGRDLARRLAHELGPARTVTYKGLAHGGLAALTSVAWRGDRQM